MLWVCRWGADTTHALLSEQPHLLSSKFSSVDSNSRGIQELLGCTDKEMERVVRKAPRLVAVSRCRSVVLADATSQLIQCSTTLTADYSCRGLALPSSMGC